MTRVVAVLASLLLGACGVPLDAEPQPFEVELAPPPEVDRAEPGDLAAVSLFLVREGQVVAVTRDLSSPADAMAVIGSLLEGTTAPEERAGLRTSIPVGTDLLTVRRENATLVLDLTRDFAAVGGEEEILAVAQIVLTATNLEGIESVAFELEGVPTDVPLANGALSEEPVAAADYRDLQG